MDHPFVRSVDGVEQTTIAEVYQTLILSFGSETGEELVRRWIDYNRPFVLDVIHSYTNTGRIMARIYWQMRPKNE